MKRLGAELTIYIFRRIHQDIKEASIGGFNAEKAWATAFNLCRFIVDEIEKAEEAMTKPGQP